MLRWKTGRRQFIMNRKIIGRYQRIYISKRTHPPCVFQTFAHPTSPHLLCQTVRYSWSILQTEQEEVGWANVWKTQGGAVPSITDIYSLIVTVNDNEIITYLYLQHHLLSTVELFDKCGVSTGGHWALYIVRIMANTPQKFRCKVTASIINREGWLTSNELY